MEKKDENVKKNKNNDPNHINLVSTDYAVYHLLVLLAIGLAGYIHFILALIIIGLLVITYLVYISKWGKAKLEQILIYRELKPYISQSISLNHTATLIAKFITGVPVIPGESEIDSFIDMKNFYGDKYAFMIQIKDTRNRKITVKGKPMTCISSYNYLDLARDERVNKAAIDAAKEFDNCDIEHRTESGKLLIIQKLEETVASFFKREKALVFSSGYLACMSALAGIARKGDLLVMDRLCHASLVAGSKNCEAKVVRFKHNDFVDAERLIKLNKYSRIIMVIEGIYSMDGDYGNLAEARKLCDKYKGILIIDEAHSLGSLGKTGHGTEEVFDYKFLPDIICGTFSKSISGVGGFITSSKSFIEIYSLFSPGNLSAPISSYHCGGAIKAFEIIQNEPERVKRLQENGHYLRKELVKNNFNIERSCTSVVPVIFKDINQVLSMHSHLIGQGVFAAAVVAPACPLDAARFRICPTSADNKESLDFIVQSLIKARDANPESAKVTKLLKLLK